MMGGVVQLEQVIVVTAQHFFAVELVIQDVPAHTLTFGDEDGNRFR
jgi:hypothetical protein